MLGASFPRGGSVKDDFNEASKAMKKKPDLLVVLVLVLGLGVLASTYTQGQPDPEVVAKQFSIR